jgi:hypothetical protein
MTSSAETRSSLRQGVPASEQRVAPSKQLRHASVRDSRFSNHVTDESPSHCDESATGTICFSADCCADVRAVPRQHGIPRSTSERDTQSMPAHRTGAPHRSAGGSTPEWGHRRDDGMRCRTPCQIRPGHPLHDSWRRLQGRNARHHRDPLGSQPDGASGCHGSLCRRSHSRDKSRSS